MIRKREERDMLTLIFAILLLSVVGKLFIWSVKAAWGLTKVLFVIIFFPGIVIGLFAAGLATLAIGLLLVAGIITLITSAVVA